MFKHIRNAVRVGIAVAVVLIAILLSLQLAESDVVRETVSQFGYVGVFVIATLSGFNLAVPLPAVSFMPLFTAAGLAFWPLMIVITVGMTLGDTIGFLIGDAGRKLTSARAKELRDGRILKYIEKFHAKNKMWPYVVLALYAAFAPAPNEVVVIPMAFAGYKLRHMFPVILIGNLVFNTLFAFGVVSVAGLL